jgi:hypothetical protein
LKTTFVNQGSPGEKCSEAFSAVRTAMLCSTAPAADEEASVVMRNLCGDGYAHLLPSFFTLLTTLCDRGIDFCIVFRTFGVDAERVSSELNLFCEGRHPLSPSRCRMDGSHLSVDRRLLLPQMGVQLVRGPHINDVTL